MFFETYEWKYWWLREWKCCGHKWEILLSNKFPERETFKPVCPRCKMKIMNIGIVGSRSRNAPQDKKQLENVLIDLIDKAKKKNVQLHLVSGGCRKGADKFAEELAKEYELGITIHYPELDRGTFDTIPKWEYARACYNRNTLIARDSDMLIAVWDKVSGGTVDTIKKMKDKPVVIL